jgi:hypothetical protein
MMDLVADGREKGETAFQLADSIGPVKSLRKWTIEGKTLVIINDVKHNEEIA